MKIRYLVSSWLLILGNMLLSLHAEQHLFPPHYLLRPLLVSWLIIGLFAALLKQFIADWKMVEECLVVTILLFTFPPKFFWIAVRLFVAVYVIWRIGQYRKRPGSRKSAQSPLSLTVSVFLVFYSIGLHVSEYGNAPWSIYFSSLRGLNALDANRLKATTAVKPDIYYIVLDGYVRSDVLKDLYRYDNSEFVGELEKEGFVVARQARSNYAKTILSITSTLNMEYVYAFAPGLDNSKFWWLMEPYIDRGRVVSLLESQGYTTVSFSTNWSLTDMASATLHQSAYPVELTDFEQYIIHTSPLRLSQPYIQDGASVFTVETQRKTILHTLDALDDFASDPNPVFVFAHILLPHPPFVFDAHGKPVQPSAGFSFKDAEDFEGSPEQYTKGYTDQVEFVNTRLQEILATILQQSDTPPIIIVQADHGSGLLTYFTSVEKTCVRERLSPFAAYYFPGMRAADIPDDLTPVNLFRLVFNKYFGGDFPLLENRYFYIADPFYIYRDVDVGLRLDQACAMR